MIWLTSKLDCSLSDSITLVPYLLLSHISIFVLQLDLQDSKSPAARSAMGEELVVLNVGGVLHTTTQSTLTRYPSSMLGSMFSGRYKPSMLRDAQGHLFIDRDGAMFRIVLNFLRSSMLCLPAGFSEFDLLEAEADFYQIPELLDAIRDRRHGKAGKCRSCCATNGEKDPTHFSGYYLEIVEFEESAYFSRLYTLPPPSRHAANGSSFKSGGLVISGHRDALRTLPLQARTLQTVEATQLSDKDFLTIPACNTDKMMLFHHLSQTGWRLVNSSFSYSTDTDGSYIVHKYIWQCPLKDGCGDNDANCVQDAMPIDEEKER